MTLLYIFLQNRVIKVGCTVHLPSVDLVRIPHGALEAMIIGKTQPTLVLLVLTFRTKLVSFEIFQ